MREELEDEVEIQLKDFEECTWCHNAPNCNCVLEKRVDRLERLLLNRSTNRTSKRLFRR